MPRNRFIAPQTVRLALSDGDWIDVKKELNAGEQRRIFTNVVKSMVAGEKTELNPELVGKTRILEYVVAWSFVDSRDQPVPFSSNALDAIDPESFSEILKAVEAHDEAAEQERETRKKEKAGEKESRATSLSAVS